MVVPISLAYIQLNSPTFCWENILFPSSTMRNASHDKNKSFAAALKEALKTLHGKIFQSDVKLLAVLVFPISAGSQPV